MANFMLMASVDYHHGNLKEALLLAGEDELNRLGPDELSLREIAKRAGVSHNAPYRHFRSKEELILLILEKSSLELAEQILSAPLFYPASILMQVQYVGRLWALMALRQPRKACLLFSTCHVSVHANLKSILEGALSTQLLADTDCSTLALILMTSFNGAAFLQTAVARNQFIHTQDDLYNLTDEVSQNILHSKLV